MNETSEMREADRNQRRRRAGLFALIAIVIALVTSPITVLALASWFAGGSWEFSGGGLRHWAFVSGTTADRFGFVAPTGAPARYVFRPAEGAFPGEIFYSYASASAPDEVVAAYAARCPPLGLVVRKTQASKGAAEAKLACESGPARIAPDDIFVVAMRAPGTLGAEVRVTVGPGLIATYGY